MTSVSVTGASGKAGGAVVRDLLEHGFDVVASDQRPSPVYLHAPVMVADLTDYGQAVELLAGCDPVVHLAAIDRAREVLGFVPQHSWRDVITEGL